MQSTASSGWDKSRRGSTGFEGTPSSEPGSANDKAKTLRVAFTDL
jgi:hypothetical protein